MNKMIRNHKPLFMTLAFPGLFIFAASILTVEELPSPTALILPVTVIFVLVILNGFFVAAEFAIIGVRPTLLEAQAANGNSQAAHVLNIVESPIKQDQYIATAQLGITIASLGLGMYGEPQIGHFIEPFLARILGVDPHATVITTVGYLIALSLLTYLHIVVGEMVPKSLALSSPLRTVLGVSRIMQFFQLALTPLVKGLNAIGTGIMTLLKVPPVQGHERVHSPEEIEDIVAQSTKKGLLDLGQEKMIRNIFDFSERTVEQVMTPRPKVQAVDATWSYDQVKELLVAGNHSRVPVYQGDLDHVIGILHLKDLVKFDLAKNPPMTWRALLRHAPSVPENYKVEKLLSAFKQEKIHMALVLDEFGGVAGIVTLEDLIEEIVGEVRDEFDYELEPLVEVSEGVLEVDGSYLVSVLREQLGKYVNLGDNDSLPDVETIGGLIVTWLGRQPTIGDKVTHNDTIHFTVTEVDGLAVSRARVEFPAYTQQTTYTNSTIKEETNE